MDDTNVINLHGLVASADNPFPVFNQAEVPLLHSSALLGVAKYKMCRE